ncbi:peptidylprolyl isomerase [Halovulum dunhuangense]|uniref:Parvulin-like PPIase n=1 Tax=Halovulum dunhuangense TaxID=1505036 RepID=A0A849L3F0_9RHOB|nr:SurA N-terminal domain-containing protein [Halovulum dunhuangense]NNU80691.1 peptidylprolyl isomerase [Halovulum dunhuangense]
MLRAFRSSSRGKGTSIVVWALLGLLIVGLTGFGLGGAVSGLSGQNVANVGDQRVSREEFVRRLFQQLDAVGAQTGQRPTMQQAQLFGLDQQVLSQLITQAALDGKAADLGLSVGDEVVREELMAEQSFQGANGFDSATYRFFLDRAGLTAAQFEEQVRRDTTRALMQSVVTDGTSMPRILAETALAFDGERRTVRLLTIEERHLETPVGTPDDAALRAQYEANPDAYTTPETRRVAYVALTPEIMATEVEITDDQARAAYDARSDSFNRPERRLVEVIAFGTEAGAAEAKAAIDAGTMSFDDIAAERGLSASDLSLGPVRREDLGAAAREAVFGAEGPGIIGPVQTDLGPSLYRLNAILPALATPFEQVQDELRQTLAEEEARGRIVDWFDPVFDLIAAGATLEEIDAETPLEFGTLELTAEMGEGLAGDMDFRQEAFELEPGEAPRDIIELENGGIAALRVDEVVPPALRPFEEVRAQVATDWAAAELARRLEARAAELQALLETGRTLDAVAADAGLTPRSPAPLSRTAQPEPGLPAGIVDTAFGIAATGESTVMAGPTAAHVVQLDEIAPVDTASEAYRQQLDTLSAALDAELGQTLFLGFAQDLVTAAAPTVNQQLIADTLAQYP